MSLYAALAKATLEMIAEFGRSVTIKRDNKGVFDPLTSTFIGASNTETIVRAVVTGYRIHEIDGEIIKRGDKKVLFDSSADIRKGDLLIDGDTFTILDIEEINPGDTKLLFKAQARK